MTKKVLVEVEVEIDEQALAGGVSENQLAQYEIARMSYVILTVDGQPFKPGR